LTTKIQELKVGKGTEKGVFIGPLTHERAVEKAMAHINGEFRIPCIGYRIFYNLVYPRRAIWLADIV
jgi:hypothetical protein